MASKSLEELETPGAPEANGTVPPSTEEAPKAEATPTEDGPIDWEARAKTAEESLKAEQEGRAKDTEDFRSKQIERMHHNEGVRNTEIVGKKLDLVLQGLIAQGQTDLTDKVKGLEEEANKKQVSEEFTSVGERSLAEINAVGEELGIKIDEHPDFDNARRFWGEAKRTGHIGYVQDALAEVHKVAARLTRQQLKAKEEGEAERIEEGVRKRMKETNPLDLSSGKESPGGSGGQFGGLTGVALIQAGLAEKAKENK